MEDFEISAEEIPGWQVAQDGDITVALDISLTDELIAEGMARELVNRIQAIRREENFNVTDRIEVHIQDHEAIQAAVSKYGDYIKTEVLCDKLESSSDLGEGHTIELPGDLELFVKVKNLA